MSNGGKIDTTEVSGVLNAWILMMIEEHKVGDKASDPQAFSSSWNECGIAGMMDKAAAAAERLMLHGIDVRDAVSICSAGRFARWLDRVTGKQDNREANMRGVKLGYEIAQVRNAVLLMLVHMHPLSADPMIKPNKVLSWCAKDPMTVMKTRYGYELGPLVPGGRFATYNFEQVRSLLAIWACNEASRGNPVDPATGKEHEASVAQRERIVNLIKGVGEKAGVNSETLSAIIAVAEGNIPRKEV